VKPEITVEILQEDNNVKVVEGSPAKLQWKIDGRYKNDIICLCFNFLFPYIL
jgi:hypothetical protein